MPVTLTCARCTRVFSAPPSSRRTYCSTACFRDSQTEATGWTSRTCEHCGGTFRLRGKEAAKRPARFCSHTCTVAANRATSRQCAQCGTDFVPKNPGAATADSMIGRYCSKRCSGLAHRNRRVRTCRHCRAQFEIKASRVDSGRGWYCSKACYSAEFTVARVCRRCGTAFQARLSEVARGWGTYCSKACVPRQVRRACGQCGDVFTAKLSVVGGGRGRYCSNACRHLGRRNRVQLSCPECGQAFSVPASAAAKGRRNCSRACWTRQLSKDPHMREVLAAARHAMLTTRTETRPERILYALLDRLVPDLAPGIAWERQLRLLDRWTVDAAIPDLRLVLQADGDYWHGLHEEDRHDPRVAGNMANDAHQDRELTEAGWQVLRFWETDLIKHLPDCADRLTRAIDGRRRQFAGGPPPPRHRLRRRGGTYERRILPGGSREDSVLRPHGAGTARAEATSDEMVRA